MSLNDFSWNRVRTALLHFDQCDKHFIKDGIILNFMYHRHSVLLNQYGFGIIYHPWNKDGRPKYKVAVPKDVWHAVKELWDTYMSPIPINPEAN